MAKGNRRQATREAAKQVQKAGGGAGAEGALWQRRSNKLLDP